YPMAATSVAGPGAEILRMVVGCGGARSTAPYRHGDFVPCVVPSDCAGWPGSRREAGAQGCGGRRTQLAARTLRLSDGKLARSPRRSAPESAFYRRATPSAGNGVAGLWSD